MHVNVLIARMSMCSGTALDDLVYDIETRLLGLGRAQPGMGHLHVQDFKYRATCNARQLDMLARDIVRHSPAPSVGPQGERYPDSLPRYYVESVGAVSRCKDIRV